MTRSHSRFMKVAVATGLIAVTLVLAGVAAGCKSRAVVVRVVPADRSSGVSRTTRIGIEFDRPMDVASVASHLRIDPPVAGGWHADQNLVYITPVEPLRPESTYRITLLSGASDVGGVTTEAAGEWVFSTPPIRYSHLPTLAPRPQIEMPGVRALAAGPEGRIYAASDSEVAAIDIGPDGIAELTRLYAGFADTTDLALDDNDRIWLLLAEKDNYRIIRLTETGSVDLTLPIAQPEYRPGEYGCFYPRNLAILPGGSVLVLGTDRIRQYSQTGAVERDIGLGILSGCVTEGYFGPTGLVVEGSRVYVNNAFAYNPSAGPVVFDLAGRQVASHPVGVGRYAGLARDRWGNLYLQEDGRLIAIGPEGDSLDALIDSPELAEHAAELLVYGDMLYAACPRRGAVRRWHLTDPIDDQFMSHADRLIRDAFGITVSMYEVDSLMYDMNVRPVQVGGREYYPVTDQRFAAYQDLETHIRSVYAPELAAQFLSDPKYIDHEGKLFTTGGEMGTRLQFDLYRFRVTRDQGGEVEIELTIPEGDDCPPDVSAMRFRLVEGQWRIASQAFGK